MMRKQNKGFDFLPMQTRSSIGKWVVLRRELGGKAVDEKSVTVGIGMGYQEDPWWAKKSTPPVRVGF